MMHDTISACHRPTQISFREKRLMDLGKTMKGIALIMRPAGKPATHPGAIGPYHSCTVGCGSVPSPYGATVTPYSPLEQVTPAKNRAPVRSSPDHECTTRPPALPSYISPGKKPRTRTNDDHSMHIPGISSHRNVNNNRIWPGAALIHRRYWSGPALTPECRELQSSL